MNTPLHIDLYRLEESAVCTLQTAWVTPINRWMCVEVFLLSQSVKVNYSFELFIFEYLGVVGPVRGYVNLE